MPNQRRDFLKLGAAGALWQPPQALAAPPSNAPYYNVLDFGAVADGKTVATAALQKAVDACAAGGGGKLVFPAGRYITSPIFLKSNVHVEVLAGATVHGSGDIEHCPSIQGRWEGIDRTVYASLFTGHDLENVSITGRGTLDGNGKVWWDAFRKTAAMRRQAGLNDRESENPAGSPLKWGRPRIINLYRCKNVWISGLTIVNSPSWNVHPVECQNVNIDGLTITGPENGPNTDGIDPDSCKDVRISNCYISVGDDCIIIKSGYVPVPGRPFTPCEDIVVTNCVFGTGHCGVGVGSETAGGVRNVTISNCVCDGTQRGLRFKTARGRGAPVEHVRASNIVMRNMLQEAVHVTMFYAGGDKKTPQPVDAGTPTFRNFHFSGITVTGARRAAVIEGLPERPMDGLTISDFVVDGAGASISCLNVTGLRLQGVSVNPVKGQPVISFENVADAVVESSTAREGTGTFLELRGPDNREITLASNRLKRAVKEIEFTAGATEKALAR